MAQDPMIKGFTTNPTLMAKSGVTDYEQFAKDALKHIAINCPEKSISLEVFADDFDEMERQALLIKSWAKEAKAQVYVKIPIMNTKGEDSYQLIRSLSLQEVPMNVTAVFTVEQVRNTLNNLNMNIPSIVSIFAGRIADAGVDPVPIFKDAMNLRGSSFPNLEFLWASPREIYNYVQAKDLGVDIITMTPDMIYKLPTIGKDLREFSRETVQMFYDDSMKSGFKI
jgi:transaldolase